MPDDLIIGCPVYRREWILPRWFEHVGKACATAGVEPVFAFVVDERDEPTVEAIAEHGGAGYVLSVRGDLHDGERRWNPRRYEWMVHLRNELLGIVRLAEPHLFLSLDSDILLHPDGLKCLMESVESCDAVGGKAYMTTTGTRHPSWARLNSNNNLFRQESDGVFPVDVIMAIKLMTASAYSIDYEFSTQGEDIGWSTACRKAGLKLLWDGRVTNKHVMSPRHLDLVDKRVGF